MATGDQLDDAIDALARTAKLGTAAVARIDAVVNVVVEAEDRWSQLPDLLGLTAEEWTEAGVEAAQERARAVSLEDEQ
jgi:hypothetical protein